MIGNTDCRFNALSSELRCAVNPDGPCEGCCFFEAVNENDKKGGLTATLIQQTFRNEFLPSTMIMDRLSLVPIDLIYIAFTYLVGFAVSSLGNSLLQKLYIHPRYSPSEILLMLTGSLGCLLFGYLLSAKSLTFLSRYDYLYEESPPIWFIFVRMLQQFTGMIFGYLFLKGFYIGISKFFL